MADTVAVRLRRNWFGPGGSRYDVADNPHEFPADWAAAPKKRDGESDEAFGGRKAASKYEVLPSTAGIVQGGKVVADQVGGKPKVSGPPSQAEAKK